MILGRVIGNVVATRKDERLQGAKLMIVLRQEFDPAVDDLIDTKRSMVAVDTVGAGVGDVVIMVSGSSATRNIEGFEKMPTDVTIVGIVDSAGAN